MTWPWGVLAALAGLTTQKGHSMTSEGKVEGGGS